MLGPLNYTNLTTASENPKHAFFAVTFAVYILAQYAVSAAFVSTFTFYALLLPAFFAYAYSTKPQLLAMLRTHELAGFLALFAFIILHAIFLTDDTTGLRKTITNSLATAGFLLCTVMFFLTAKKDFVRNFLHILVIVSAICAAVSIIKFLYFTGAEDIRLKPLGRTENQVLGALMYGVVGIISLHLHYTSASLREKFFYVGVSALVAYMIYLTDSRTPFFGYLTALILCWQLHTKNVWRTLIIFWSVVAAVGIAFFTIDAVHDFFAHYTAPFFERGDSFRSQLWNQTIEKILENPVWGNGMRTRLTPPDNTVNAYMPHSIYLATPFYIGIPASIAFFYLVLRCMFHGFSMAFSHNSFKIMGVCLFYYALFSGMTDHGQLVKSPSPLWVIFWLPIGFIIADKIARSALTSPKNEYTHE